MASTGYKCLLLADTNPETGVGNNDSGVGGPCSQEARLSQNQGVGVEGRDTVSHQHHSAVVA